MDRRITGVVDLRRQRRVEAPPGLRECLRELALHVAPFDEPQPGNELRTTMLDQAPVRELLLLRFGEEFPQRDQRQEIRALVAKAQMRLVRGLAPLEGPIARIRHGQCARDDERLGDATFVARRLQDPADSRVERKARELATRRRERVRRIDGAELLQQLVSVGDRAR